MVATWIAQDIRAASFHSGHVRLGDRAQLLVQAARVSRERVYRCVLVQTDEILLVQLKIDPAPAAGGGGGEAYCLLVVVLRIALVEVDGLQGVRDVDVGPRVGPDTTRSGLGVEQEEGCVIIETV